jgi:hypothetical protein
MFRYRYGYGYVRRNTVLVTDIDTYMDTPMDMDMNTGF